MTFLDQLRTTDAVPKVSACSRAWTGGAFTTPGMLPFRCKLDSATKASFGVECLACDDDT